MKFIVLFVVIASTALSGIPNCFVNVTNVDNSTGVTMSEESVLNAVNLARMTVTNPDDGPTAVE